MLSCKILRSGDDSGDDDQDHKLNTIANNDDLVTEILLRLPLKSVTRFKSVDKRWLSLISSHSFARRHYLRNPNYISGLFLQSFLFRLPPNSEFISLDGKATNGPFKCFTFHNISTAIKDSCNGLLCCCGSSRVNDFRSIYYIYNPSKKQYNTLPQLGDTDVFGVYLAYDPCKSPHYKVVCVRKRNDSFFEKYSQIDIYSSETSMWRLSVDYFTMSGNLLSRGVFWNGAIHWIGRVGNGMYFDVNRECLQTMLMPPVPEGWNEREFLYFGASGGHLHLILKNKEPYTCFDVLEMERDYSRWSVKYRVALEPVITAYPEMIQNNLDLSDLEHYQFSILCLVRGKEEEDEEGSKLVLHVPGKVISYNLKDKSLTKLHGLMRNIFSLRNGSEKPDSLKYTWVEAFEDMKTSFAFDHPLPQPNVAIM